MYADGPAKARITSNTSTNIARDAIFTTILLCGPSACMARFTHFLPQSTSLALLILLDS